MYKEGTRGNPIYSEHYRPMVIESENEKEYILDIGTMNKRSNKFKLNWDKDTRPYYTEQEKQDGIYINDTKYKIAEKVEKFMDANKLKAIEKILNK